MIKSIRYSSAAPFSIVQRARMASMLAIPVRLLLPHGVILGAAFASITRTLDRPECVGLCALYAGSLTYAVLLVAVVLSSLVAAGQLFLFRH